MRFPILCALLVSLLFPATTFAGFEKGNGGDAVVGADGRVFLLDLFEAGIESSASVETIQDSKIRVPLANVFYQQGAMFDALVSKLSAVQMTDPGLAFGLLQVMRLLDWRWANSPLREIPDEDSPLDLRGNRLFQLAARLGQAVTIEQSLWERMSPANQAALVFHEALYALIRPERDADDRLVQSSVRVRRLNSYLFSAGFGKRNHERLEFLMAGAFPSAKYGKRAPTGDTLWASPKLVFRLAGDSLEITPETSSKEAREILAGLCEKLVATQAPEPQVSPQLEGELSFTSMKVTPVAYETGEDPRYHFAAETRSEVFMKLTSLPRGGPYCFQYLLKKSDLASEWFATFRP